MNLRSLALAGILVCTTLQFGRAQAESPIAITYGRTFSASNWDFFCLGFEGDVGTCEANKNFGLLKVAIRADSAEIRVKASGKCLSSDFVRRRAWNPEDFSTSQAAGEVKEFVMAAFEALPQKCRFAPSQETLDSVNDVAAFLIDMAD